ncbi:hypothetical protein AUC61_22350 [Pseudomonas sp. S25]|uniref:Uncharacterized protein n=1 Tax=Pseudomonas maioricensis TaxID=1766623 RepID=A0ABS9ZNW5_9PSED|nr:hypothetical protein [Pseudomonas sp. S25]MCI8212278.1 hypothetical protein [Pseudomonas sp. S25]
MNKFKKKNIKRWLIPAFISTGLTYGAHANTEQTGAINITGSETTAAEPVVDHPLSEPKFSVLEDKLHSLNDALTSKHPVHYYGFVSRRGQDVILMFPGGNPTTQAWKVEYYENGNWVAHNLRSKVFSNLEPGAELIIRVTPANQQHGASIPYSLSFGSYPVLKKYDLHDEPGVIRIPTGYSEPGWLATQAYKEALLEVVFTDTKGAPVEGGQAYFRLNFEGAPSGLGHFLVSDANGLAARKVELGRCYGGKQAQDFVHKQKGFNTWRSYYRVGDYTLQNLASFAIGDKPHTFKLGHICKQTLINTTRPRT